MVKSLMTRYIVNLNIQVRKIHSELKHTGKEDT